MTEQTGQTLEQASAQTQPSTTQTSPSVTAPIVQVTTPLERPEFDHFIKLYMKRMGMKDEERLQAAIQLTKLFSEIGLNPYGNLEETIAKVNNITALLQSMPDSPGASKMKDLIAQQTLASVGEQFLGGERNLMKAVMKEILVPMMMVREVGRMFFNSDGGSLANDVAELKAWMKSQIKETELEKAMEPLKAEIQELRQMINKQSGQQVPIKSPIEDFTEKMLKTIFDSYVEGRTDEIKTLKEELKELRKRDSVDGFLEFVEKLRKAEEVVGPKEWDKDRLDFEKWKYEQERLMRQWLEEQRFKRDELKEATKRLQELGLDIRTVVKEVGNPLARAVSAGYIEGKFGKKNLETLSDSELQQYKHKAEVAKQIGTQVLEQIEAEERRRKTAQGKL